MTKSEHQSAAMHVPGHPPLNTRTSHNFGAVGTRRPIVKKSHHAIDLNGNSPMSIDIPAGNAQHYKLFGDSSPPLPFSQYQRSNYSEFLQHNSGQLHQAHYGQHQGAPSPLTNTQYQLPSQNYAGSNSLNPNACVFVPDNSLYSTEQFPFSANSNTDMFSPNTLASALSTLEVSPSSRSLSSPSEMVDEGIDTSDSEDEDEPNSQTHPNKYPVEIEYHDLQNCGYRRQSTKSGPKMKQQTSMIYDPLTGQQKPQVQRIKYYQKHLVRICRCGKYSQMDGALVHGRANDCDGYEIHYSQKCKWKAYDDYKTGKRVLIRLCKCYKPF